MVNPRLDEKEINHLIDAVQKMNLKYIVITSVTRDDLPDGGASVFADCIGKLREVCSCLQNRSVDSRFSGESSALEKVIAAKPDVINHNMEVVKPLFARLRPQGNYNFRLNSSNK